MSIHVAPRSAAVAPSSIRSKMSPTVKQRSGTGTHRVPTEDSAAVTLHWGEDVVLYVRSSSDDQQRSCPQQVAAIEAYAKSEGWLRERAKLSRKHNPEEGVYADDGISGWKYDPEQREGCGALLKFCEGNPRLDSSPGMILIWALSRLGRFKRGPEEAIYWIHHFRRAGWKVRSITQPGLDSDDKDRLLAVIRTALESEKDTSSSEEKGKGVSRGKEDLIRLGVWHGGAAPFGYERWAAKVDEQKGEITEWVEELAGNKRNGNPGTHTVLRPSALSDRLRSLFRLSGYGESGRVVSLEEIARRFNAERVPIRGRKAGQGKAWYHTTLSKVLKNEKYLGIQRDAEGREHKALWEPLVDRDLWDLVQKRLSENARQGKGANAAYVLSGILHCATCEQPLHGDCTDGVFYYKAKRVAPGAERCLGCRTRVRADVIEPAVLKVIPRLADDPICQQVIREEREVLRGSSLRLKDRSRELATKIRDRELQLDRLVDVLSLGGAAGEAVNKKMVELNAEIEHLQRERTRLAAGERGRAPAAERASEAGTFMAAFSEGSAAERKSLIAHLVARVEVDIPLGKVKVGFRRPPLIAM